MNKEGVFIILLNVFLMLNTYATTYYIDSGSGKDTNSGLSPKDPWKSLWKVNAQEFKAGDSVLFRSSTSYNGQLKISCRGKEGSTIVFTSYGEGQRPRIEGQGNYNEAVFIFNSEYITFANFEITNKGAVPKPERKGVHLLIDDYGIAHQVLISGLFIHDVNGSNIKNEGGGSGIHWTNRGQKVKTCFDGLVIEKCRLERTDRNGITGDGYWQRKDWFPSKHVVIRNNHLEDIGGDGIVPIGCDGAIVEYNVIYHGGQRFPEGDASAGIWPWSCDNTLVQYNEVAYMAGPWDGQGFDSDWNCNNSVFQYNYSHDNEGGFFLVCSPTEGNEAGNNGTIIRYNISQNDGHRVKWKAAGFSPVFHITGPVKNTHIYNNVIYRDRKRDKKEDKSLITFDTWGGLWPDSTFFANNIFYSVDSASYKWGKSTHYFFSNNCFYGKHINGPMDSKVVSQNPQFIKGGTGRDGLNTLEGYKLLKNSPCKNKGAIMELTISKDFFGNPIPGEPSKYNIGVHQF